MRCGNAGMLLCGQRIKPGIAQAARPVLAGVLGNLHPAGSGIVQKERHMMRAAELCHKAGIRMGSFAPDSVVHMGRHDGDAKFRFAAQQKTEQRHRIRPAGAGNDDTVPQPKQTLPAAIGQQGLFHRVYWVLQ